jgi:hypothetical protein
LKLLTYLDKSALIYPVSSYGGRSMKTVYKVPRILIVIILALSVLGCAEAKIGIGPFKAASVEIGPGGVEAKGPSAGPFKTKSVESKLDREDGK